MGKRKRAATILRKPKKFSDLPLPTSFDCPSCFHKGTVYVKMNKKDKIGNLSCGTCGVTHEMPINNLSAPIDVYYHWMDRVNAVNEQEREAERVAKRQKREEERKIRQQQKAKEMERMELEKVRETEQSELDRGRERQRDLEEEEEFDRMMEMMRKSPAAGVENSSQPGEDDRGSEGSLNVQRKGREGTVGPARDQDNTREINTGQPIDSSDVAPTDSSLPPEEIQSRGYDVADQELRQNEIDDEERELEKELDLEEQERGIELEKVKGVIKGKLDDGGKDFVDELGNGVAKLENELGKKMHKATEILKSIHDGSREMEERQNYPLSPLNEHHSSREGSVISEVELVP